MIETIEIEYRSGIESWGGWPDDVVNTLKLWNKRGELTFTRIGVLGKRRVFRCVTCQKWHEPASNGVAVKDGHAYCDGCLIVLARAGQLSSK